MGGGGVHKLLVPCLPCVIMGPCRNCVMGGWLSSMWNVLYMTREQREIDINILVIRLFFFFGDLGQINMVIWPSWGYILLLFTCFNLLISHGENKLLWYLVGQEFNTLDWRLIDLATSFCLRLLISNKLQTANLCCRSLFGRLKPLHVPRVAHLILKQGVWT